MSRTILLYGADELLGGLLLAEAVDAWADPGGTPKHRLLVGGRNASRVQALAQQNGLTVRVLDLTQPDLLVQQLEDVDVLVNAASPFAETALVLARAAICAPCHVIDLNTEVDVFVALGKLAKSAEDASCALVRSAGSGSVASSLMVKAALHARPLRGWHGTSASGCCALAKVAPAFNRRNAATETSSTAASARCGP